MIVDKDEVWDLYYWVRSSICSHLIIGFLVTTWKLHISGFFRFLAFGVDCNYNMGSAGTLFCTWQIVGLFSLHTQINLFFIINLYLYISFYMYLSTNLSVYLSMYVPSIYHLTVCFSISFSLSFPLFSDLENLTRTLASFCFSPLDFYFAM